MGAAMRVWRKIRKILSGFSVKVFLVFILCVILPMNGMFRYMKSRFEETIQAELSRTIIQSMSKSQQEIYSVFQNMANISSMLMLDNKLSDVMSNPQVDFYEKMVAFDAAVANITTYNLFTIADMKITFFDSEGRVYSNWSVNYNDYSFLLGQDWVQQSIAEKGHIVWSMFSPGYVIGEGGISAEGESEQTYISLARLIPNDEARDGRAGILLVSLEQTQFSKLLTQYFYAPNDAVYVCVDNGDVLLKQGELLSDEQVRAAAGRARADSGSLRENWKDQQYLVSYYTLQEPWTFGGSRLRVLHYTDYRSVLNQMRTLSRQMDLSIGVFLAVLVLVVGLISVRIVHPVRVLAHQMGVYSINGELEQLDLSRKDEIGHLNRAFLRMSDRIKELFSNLTHEHEVREKYRFEALRAQVNPHFLFNTLNMIRWMAMIRRADNITESIDALANMLKYSMSRGGELVSLAKELENIRSYVFIQNCRFGDRFTLSTDLDEQLMGLHVIKFILQPVVENAVIHGFTDDRGTIRIYGGMEEGKLCLYVEDNGKGMAPEQLERLVHPGGGHRDDKKVTGIGLYNVNERIQVTYGEPFGITVKSEPNGGTIVAYTLPVLEGGDLDEEVDDR